MESEFVLVEYTREVYKWMPQSVALDRIINDRSGHSVIVNRETTSQLLIEPEQINFLKNARSNKEFIYYNDSKSEEIKNNLLPVINRRMGLLINTVRFMGVAKQSGLSLLEYIEQNEEKH
jgi:hypothetical protein